MSSIILKLQSLKQCGIGAEIDKPMEQNRIPTDLQTYVTWFLHLYFILCESDSFSFFFFLCPLSVLVWLRLQSLSASSPDLLVTASSLFLRLWLGFAMVTWQAFPGEGRSHVPEHLFYFSEHDQEWHQSRADHCLEVLGFFKQKKKQKQKQESFPPPLK